MVYLLSSFVFRHVEAGGHVVSHVQMKKSDVSNPVKYPVQFKIRSDNYDIINPYVYNITTKQMFFETTKR